MFYVLLFCFSILEHWNSTDEMGDSDLMKDEFEAGLREEEG